MTQTTINLTIRREGAEYVARDARGTWHGRGRVDLCEGPKGMPLAASLFHREEIADGTTSMELIRW